MAKKTIVIAGAPGIGKSYLFREAEKLKLAIADSDSVNFSWLKPGVRNPEFPKNYVEHVVWLIGKADIICVSTHYEVRQALVDSGIDFVLVYPSSGQKDEYIRRFRECSMKSGETQQARQGFINLMSENWEKWVDEQLPNQKHCIHLKLRKGEYLMDRISEILDL